VEGLLLAGHPDIQGLCLALSDWSAELQILREEQRRQEGSRRRVGKGTGDAQGLRE